jgi:hypothetical protein
LEYVQLVANWNYLIKQRQYDCANKTYKMKEVQAEAFRNRNGCGFRIQKKPRQTVGILNFHSCFCDHLHDQFGYLLLLHDRYQNGLLPFPGSISEQPNHIIEIFNVLDGLKTDYQKELNKTKVEK